MRAHETHYFIWSQEARRGPHVGYPRQVPFYHLLPAHKYGASADYRVDENGKPIAGKIEEYKPIHITAEDQRIADGIAEAVGFMKQSDDSRKFFASVLIAWYGASFGCNKPKAQRLRELGLNRQRAWDYRKQAESWVDCYLAMIEARASGQFARAARGSALDTA